jgi:hypothetical protein
MGVTPVDLYRNGNASSARLDHVRTGGGNPDVDVQIKPNGDLWVIANGKGVSTSDAPDEEWNGKPWKLAKGHVYSSLLVVWNDDPGHWVWMPDKDMLLSSYIDELRLSNAQFVKVTP